MPIYGLMTRITTPIVTMAAASVAALALAAPAAATTYCVPAFHPACQAGGGSIATANLETALQGNASDGQADRVVIDAVTVSDPNTFETAGSDDLEIVGAGPGDTRVTSSANAGNIFVLNLFAGGGDREVTMRDLTVVIPASFPDDQGGGLQAFGDTVENVDIESRNPGSNGAPSMGEGTVFRDGALYGAAGGSFFYGIATQAITAGTLEVERATVSDASYGLVMSDPQVVAHVRRSRIVNAGVYGLFVSGGGGGTVTNTVIESTGGMALSANVFGSATSIITAKHVTMVRTGGADVPAMEAKVNGGAAGGVNVVVSDSIIRGFGSSYVRSAPASSPDGDALLTLRHSNFAPVGTSSGDGALNTATGNINADPLFAGPLDFHLQPGSPSIDGSEPGGASPPADDFEGLPRPRDGNGDGSALRDQGAFEYQPPAPGPAAKKKCKKRKRKGKPKAAGAKKKRKKCKRRKKRGK